MHQRGAYKQIVLGRDCITLPDKWLGKPTRLRYADIRQINEKIVVGYKSMQRIGGAMTILELIHPGGKAVIIVEMLSSRADAELIIQKCKAGR